eukprot:jgi/Chlat1/1359/Chrsp119S08663
MLVRVRGAGEGEVEEWALVELQGELDIKAAATLQGLEIGRMRLNHPQQNTITLTIGYHELEGKEVALKKPFAVLRKRRTPIIVKDDKADSDDSTAGVEYDIVGVVRRKYLFKTRPRAIIASEDNK